jgi:aarF domain-containing kinase
VLLLRAIRRYLRAVFRVTELACLAAPIAVAVPIARTFSPWAPGLEDRAWNLVTSALERGGPVFIKLAQWAATREDLFPVALTAKFSRLQDQTKLHSWAETERRLDAEMPDWRDRLTLEPKPVGSGCIAQVYKGKLRRKKQPRKSKKGGETEEEELVDVAVKVLHPQVVERVAVDMNLLRSFIGAVEWAVPKLEYLSLGDLVYEFEKILTLQLDMRVEAKNLSQLRANFLSDKELSLEVRDVCKQKDSGVGCMYTRTYYRTHHAPS